MTKDLPSSAAPARFIGVLAKFTPAARTLSSKALPVSEVKNSVIFQGVRIGKGALVLVTPKGKQIKDVSELKNLAKIAMPDSKKAIYGVRTTEFLKNSGLEADLAPKMLPVAGVPQVVAYVTNGEVDAGFINSTEAVARKGEFGSVIYIDEALYSPVFISAAKLPACEGNEACAKFIDEIKTPRSKKIFAKFGLK